MTSANSAPAVPIPSATIIVVRQRDEMEVLLVERAAAGPFGSAHVFPGGKMDADDRFRPGVTHSGLARTV
jgi:8-oxo-dGTP pyrophosphatase MutT (NUDIX family)